MEYLTINGVGNGSTAVSNTFIDRYMITAGSTHLKTYLMLLRMLSQNPEKITVASMADRLDCGESDVIRSLKHWEKKGLMLLEFSEDGSTLTGLTLLDPDKVYAEQEASLKKGIGKAFSGQVNEGMTAEQKATATAAGRDTAASVAGRETTVSVSGQETTASAAGEEATASAAGQNKMESAAGMEKTMAAEGRESDHEVSRQNNAGALLPEKNVDLNVLSEDDSFSQLLFIAETYLGRPLTHSDCETFGWLYDKLKMNTDLLEYLVEYCVSNNHMNVRYMEAVAIDWHQKKIETVDQAKIYTPLNGQKIYAIMKALGLGNRQPGAAERQVIDSWFTKYGFSVDMIVEACNRTMLTIHKPQLSYVESILNRWKEAGIEKLEQVKQLDEKKQKAPAHKNASNRNASGKRQGTNKAGAAMQDFSQRSTDYDNLMKQLTKGNDHN